MTIIEEAPLDSATLDQFVFRAVDEVGATLNAARVVMATGSACIAYGAWQELRRRAAVRARVVRP
jgi:hypothetical protein